MHTTQNLLEPIVQVQIQIFMRNRSKRFKLEGNLVTGHVCFKFEAMKRSINGSTLERFDSAIAREAGGCPWRKSLRLVVFRRFIGVTKLHCHVNSSFFKRILSLADFHEFSKSLRSRFSNVVISQKNRRRLSALASPERNNGVINF